MAISIGAKHERRRLTWQGRHIDWSAYAFILPFVLPFVLFTFLAILFGAFVAFTDWGIVGQINWIGLKNFREAFTDPYAIEAFSNTLRYALIVVPSVTVFGFIFAVFVNQRWPGHLFARAAFYVPNVVSAPVIGLIWVWMLDTQFGIVNQYLGVRIPWLTSAHWALIGVSLASIWWDLGLAFILFLAGLQDVNAELIEVANVDGASRLQSLRYITMPLMRRTFSLVITLQLISTLRIFSQVHIMTDGGPAGASSSAVQYIYNSGITKYRLGYASTLSLMLFVVIMTTTLILRKVFPERD